MLLVRCCWYVVVFVGRLQLLLVRCSRWYVAVVIVVVAAGKLLLLVRCHRYVVGTLKMMKTTTMKMDDEDD